MLFGLASIMSVAAIQADRYIVASRRASSSSSSSATHRSVASGAIWLNAGFWASAPILGWHRYGIEASGVSCTIDYLDPDFAYVTWLGCVFFVW